MNYVTMPGLPKSANFRRENLCFVPNTPERIIREVSEYLNVSFEKMKEKTRERHICYARQLCMYFMCSRTSLSLKSIGEKFGSRDHTTVIHAKNTIKDLLDVDRKVINDVDHLSNLF